MYFKIATNILISCFIVQSSICVAELKDPKLRDENISATEILVEYFMRPDGLMEYVYTINSSLENKGILSTFLVDLTCDFQFEPVTLPYANGKEGYMEDIGIIDASSTPVAIHADYGSASPYGITSFGSAMWGLYHSPGSSSSGLRLITTAKLGMRTYSVEPYMDNNEPWDYPEAADPAIPWIPDFTITGMIAAPGCPGVTEPLAVALFAGSGHNHEKKNINKLLQYGNLDKNRFHVDKGTKEVEFHIYYNDDVDAKTFKVKPEHLKNHFNPVAGTNEKVTLPLKKYRNKIKLSVHSLKKDKDEKSKYAYKDTDKFEIRVSDGDRKHYDKN